MKRIVIISSFILCVFAGKLRASGSQIEFVARSTGTTITVWVTTTPAILISSGTGIETFSPSFTSQLSTGGPVAQIIGQKMRDRYFIEILNDSPQDIWVGHDVNVSSQVATNRGRRIPANGGSWAHDCSIDHYAIAGTSTGYMVTVTQEK